MVMASKKEEYKKPFDGKPVYPDILTIETSAEYKTKAVSKKAFNKGGKVVSVIGITDGVKRWTSVQYSKTRHIELNSELVYLNHSCDPNIIFDTKNSQLLAGKEIKVGDELTFFYPSTEWEMDQSFECWCGGSKCLKFIDGAKNIGKERLKGFVLSEHIKELLDTQ